MESTQRKLVPYAEARYLLGGIGNTKLFELMDAGQLERVKIGARGFITVDSINRFVDGLSDG